MPSPFPGMDPYLEAADIWPDFHDRFAGQISAELNRTLPTPYYARLEMRLEVGIVESDQRRRIVPDVTVLEGSQFPAESAANAVAVMKEPRTQISKSIEISFPSESIGHRYVEIRDKTHGHALITLIEFVSPSNKRPGNDRRAYLSKQREVLESSANLIELDLLRGGEPVVAVPNFDEVVSAIEPSPDYLLVIHRAWQRGARDAHQLFPFTLREMFPCIPMPLHENEPEIPLDLQYVFENAYESGPYQRGAIDYAKAPEPPLNASDAAWVDDLLKAGSRL